MIKQIGKYLNKKVRGAKKWMYTHPKEAAMIKIGMAGVAAGATVFGIQKAYHMGYKSGYSNAHDLALDAFLPEEGNAARLIFRYPIEDIPREAWPEAMKSLADNGVNELFYQDGKEIVGLFSEISNSEVPNIIEGFVEAGANPERFAMMLESGLKGGKENA